MSVPMGRNAPGLIAFWPDSIIPIAIVKWERRLLETEGREPLDGGERLLRAEVTEIVADCPGPGRGARLPTVPGRCTVSSLKRLRSPSNK